jgi:hypothetical protein
VELELFQPNALPAAYYQADDHDLKSRTMGKYLLEEVGTLQWLFIDEWVRDTCSLASIMLITLSYIPVPQSCPLLIVCRKLPNSHCQPDVETTFSNPFATNRFTRSALASDS